MCSLAVRSSGRRHGVRHVGTGNETARRSARNPGGNWAPLDDLPPRDLGCVAITDDSMPQPGQRVVCGLAAILCGASSLACACLQATTTPTVG